MFMHDKPIVAPPFPHKRPAAIHGFFETVLLHRVGVLDGRRPGKISSLMRSGIIAQGQLERAEVG